MAATAVAVAQPQRSSDSDRVVARIGSRTITVGELEQRIASVPPFQLRVLGSTPDEIRRAFLEQMIQQELMALGGRAEQLDRRPDVLSRQRAVLRSAMLAQLRIEMGDGSDISSTEVREYYEAHEETYRGEMLIKLWQIVVSSRAEAETVLNIIKTDPAYQKDPVKRWGELVQEYSIDEATKRRKGNLDFVRPDGGTLMPGVQVSPALYQAAETVADGEVVAKPIEVGGRFVIVQRRGTRKGREQTLESAAPAIRRKLVQQRYEERVRGLTKELRQKYKPEVFEERVDVLTVTVPHGDIETVRRPGGLPRARHPSAGSPRPVGRPGYLR